jgi:ribosome biogenesis protein ERB1
MLSHCLLLQMNSELGTNPYLSPLSPRNSTSHLRYHARAIRSVAYHTTYPLFATSSDDGSIQIFHSRVYNDLMSDPLIVPLKILRGHRIADGLGVLDVNWMQSRPWLVSAGADAEVSVWCP